MLSGRAWNVYVPRDYEENVAYRSWLLEECAKNPELAGAVRGACAEDICFYINSFVYQFNPDNIGHEVEPLILYDFQETALLGGDVEVDGTLEHEWGVLECIEDQQDVRWPKSRKMGASWISLCAIDWLCMFHRNKMVGVLSRDEDSVDQAGDPNSLFWKVEFMHGHLPDWLKGNITKRRNRFLYDDTDSFVVGEANTPSAFVSGRATVIVIDEFGQFKNGAETFEMTSDVSLCRIFVFTHKDQSGMAYDLCFDPKYEHMREIVTHWTKHPLRKRGLYRYVDETNSIEIIDKLFEFAADYNFVYASRPAGGPYPGLRSPWYDGECMRRSDRDVAMNLDIDPRGASDKFFDPHRIGLLKAEFCRAPCWIGSLKYDGATGQPIELIECADGLIKMWVMPKRSDMMPEMRYGAGTDVAAGTGVTPSCLSIFSADTGQKVLEYLNANIFSNQFAEFCVACCRLFLDRHGNGALLGWELQGGSVFGRRVHDLGYSRVWIRREEDGAIKKMNNKGLPGVNVSGAAVLPVMNNYRDALYDRSCVNHSEFALDETLRFVHTKSGVDYRGRIKPRKTGDEGSGATLHHGDIVTADMLAWKMVEQLGLAVKLPEMQQEAPIGSLLWRRQFNQLQERFAEDLW